MDWNQRAANVYAAFEYDEKSGQICFSRDRYDKAMFTITHDFGITYVYFSNLGSHDLIRLALEYAESEGKKNGSTLIMTEGKDHHWNSNSFLRLQYAQVAKDSVFGKCFPDSNWYRNLGKGTFRKLNEKIKRIEEILKERKQKDPTFQFDFTGTRMRMKKIQLYYKGADETLHLLYRNKKLYLWFNETKYAFHTLHDIQNTFDILFNELDKSTRLKNLFNPPKRYFKRCVHLSAGRTTLNEAIYNYIFQDLASRYSFEEIEEQCYHWITEHKVFPQKKMDYSPIQILSFWDRIYYLKPENKFKVFELDQMKYVISQFVTDTDADYQKMLINKLEKELLKKDAQLD